MACMLGAQRRQAGGLEALLTESHRLELQSEGDVHDLTSHLLLGLPQVMSLAVVQSEGAEHDLRSHLSEKVGPQVESRNMLVHSPSLLHGEWHLLPTSTLQTMPWGHSELAPLGQLARPVVEPEGGYHASHVTRLGWEEEVPERAVPSILAHAPYRQPDASTPRGGARVRAAACDAPPAWGGSRVGRSPASPKPVV